ncbi:hypothetical protein J6590_062989 [Homalodisca vitripennis]|nr:hypothetical protein J6590_062989 [Homalodisca vitripennis]
MKESMLELGDRYTAATTIVSEKASLSVTAQHSKLKGRGRRCRQSSGSSPGPTPEYRFSRPINSLGDVNGGDSRGDGGYNLEEEEAELSVPERGTGGSSGGNSTTLSSDVPMLTEGWRSDGPATESRNLLSDLGL